MVICPADGGLSRRRIDGIGSKLRRVEVSAPNIEGQASRHYLEPKAEGSIFLSLPPLLFSMNMLQ